MLYPHILKVFVFLQLKQNFNFILCLCFKLKVKVEYHNFKFSLQDRALSHLEKPGTTVRIMSLDFSTAHILDPVWEVWGLYVWYSCLQYSGPTGNGHDSIPFHPLQHCRLCTQHTFHLYKFSDDIVCLITDGETDAWGTTSRSKQGKPELVVDFRRQRHCLKILKISDVKPFVTQCNNPRYSLKNNHIQ